MRSSVPRSFQPASPRRRQRKIVFVLTSNRSAKSATVYTGSIQAFSGSRAFSLRSSASRTRSVIKFRHPQRP
jgi:hypothetical protein